MRQVWLTIRTSQEIKEILERTALEELRTISGQVEMIIVKWLEDQGLLHRTSPK